jgi:hypothetical protein
MSITLFKRFVYPPFFFENSYIYLGRNVLYSFSVREQCDSAQKTGAQNHDEP